MVYEPKIAIHPGRHIVRLLDELGVNQSWLSERAGVSRKLISQVINGEALISPDLAVSLENVFGVSAEFWSNLNSNYLTAKSKIDRVEKAKEEAVIYKDDIFSPFYNELAKAGYVETTRKGYVRVLNLQRFFGINSLDKIETTQSAAFRTAKDKNYDKYAMAAWLRCGEIKRNELTLEPYDEKKFRASIPRIKSVIYEMPKDFWKELVSIFAESGVALVAVKHLDRTYASGVARWIGQNPMIMVSDRGKRDDKIWFTLFHEIGHIILKHGKSESFIELDEGMKKTKKEQDADDFATENLIPKTSYLSFINEATPVFTKEKIIEFASREKIPAGVIVGRLQHDERILYSMFNDLKKTLYISE